MVFRLLFGLWPPRCDVWSKLSWYEVRYPHDQPPTCMATFSLLVRHRIPNVSGMRGMLLISYQEFVILMAIHIQRGDLSYTKQLVRILKIDVRRIVAKSEY